MMVGAEQFLVQWKYVMDCAGNDIRSVENIPHVTVMLDCYMTERIIK